MRGLVDAGYVHDAPSEIISYSFDGTFQQRRPDLAIIAERRAGRRVFMDFNRNPLPIPGDAEFALDRLDPDVRAYLRNAGALLATTRKVVYSADSFTHERQSARGR